MGYVKMPDGAYIAYMTTGQGPIDVVWQPEIWSNIDVVWQMPRWAAWFRGLATFSRLILHDRRSTGASSRNVAPPNLETRVADCLAVLDAVESERPVLGGELEGGAANVMLAATKPERVHSLFWWYPAPRSTQASDYPWGGTDQDLERRMQERATWGTPEFDDPDDPTSPWGLFSRQSSTPDVAVELELIWRQTDVRGALPAVTSPTLLMARENDREALEYLAALMPNASVRLFPGTGDSLPSIAEQPAVLRVLEEFIGVAAPEPELDTVLATVLFTDIVGSTERQAALGDWVWKELAGRHHALVRDALQRWRGVEIDTAGDSFYATFDGPARAIRCAQEVTLRVQELGIQVRAGVHTGECTMIDGKIGGIGVAIGARIAASAAASEVLVSQTVKDLVAGSGITFKDTGVHELKGVPERWRLYAAVPD
jgi:class 3 adenylate cyclase